MVKWAKNSTLNWYYTKKKKIKSYLSITRPCRHQLSTVLNLNSLLKCWVRPQLRKFSNHRHQHSWVYTQLSKIFMFSTLLSIYSTPFFSRIQAVSWNVQSTQNEIYIHQEWCLLRNEYMSSNFSFTSV